MRNSLGCYLLSLGNANSLLQRIVEGANNELDFSYSFEYLKKVL